MNRQSTNEHELEPFDEHKFVEYILNRYGDRGPLVHQAVWSCVAEHEGLYGQVVDSAVARVTRYLLITGYNSSAVEELAGTVYMLYDAFKVDGDEPDIRRWADKEPCYDCGGPTQRFVKHDCSVQKE